MCWSAVPVRLVSGLRSRLLGSHSTFLQWVSVTEAAWVYMNIDYVNVKYDNRLSENIRLSICQLLLRIRPIKPSCINDTQQKTHAWWIYDINVYIYTQDCTCFCWVSFHSLLFKHQALMAYKCNSLQINANVPESLLPYFTFTLTWKNVKTTKNNN